MSNLFMCLVLAMASGVRADDWGVDEQKIVEIVQQVPQLKQEKAAALPEKKDEVQSQIVEQLGKLDGIADRRNDDPRAQTSVAVAFVKVGEPERALPRAERAVALTPNDPQALLLRAQVKYKLGDNVGAAADAEHVLRVDTRSQQAFVLLKLTQGRSNQRGTGGAAQAQAQRSSQGGSAPPATATGKSQAPAPAAGGGLPDASLTAAADRRKAAGLLQDARNKAKLGDWGQALALFDKAAMLDPTDPAAYQGLAQARLAGGDAAGALQDAQNALTLDAGRPEALLLKARALEALGRPAEEVLSAYEAARRREPSYSAYYEEALARLSGRVDPEERAPGMTPAGARPWVWVAYWRDQPLRLGLLAGAGVLIGGALFLLWILRRARNPGP